MLLKDPIISIKNIKNKKNQTIDKDLINQKYILGIGRLTKQKNFKLLLQSFFQLNRKYPEYKLYILGDGEEKIALNNMIDKYKLKSKVFLLGHQDNVFNYLKYSECFILSSLCLTFLAILCSSALRRFSFSLSVLNIPK